MPETDCTSLYKYGQLTIRNEISELSELAVGTNCTQNRRAYQNQRRQRWRARKKVCPEHAGVAYSHKPDRLTKYPLLTRRRKSGQRSLPLKRMAVLVGQTIARPIDIWSFETYRLFVACRAQRATNCCHYCFTARIQALRKGMNPLMAEWRWGQQLCIGLSKE